MEAAKIQLRAEVKGKKATPKVKHHKFFAQRHVEVQFIPRPYALRVMAKL